MAYLRNGRLPSKPTRDTLDPITLRVDQQDIEALADIGYKAAVATMWSGGVPRKRAPGLLSCSIILQMSYESVKVAGRACPEAICPASRLDRPLERGEAVGLKTSLILLAAPLARTYYPHIGMAQHDSCWVIPMDAEIPTSSDEGGDRR
jgi:hypothetical protein